MAPDDLVAKAESLARQLAEEARRQREEREAEMARQREEVAREREEREAEVAREREEREAEAARRRAARRRRLEGVEAADEGSPPRERTPGGEGEAGKARDEDQAEGFAQFDSPEALERR